MRAAWCKNTFSSVKSFTTMDYIKLTAPNKRTLYISHVLEIAVLHVNISCVHIGLGMTDSDSGDPSSSHVTYRNLI